MDSGGSDRPQRRTAVAGRELDQYKFEIAALSETLLAEEGLLTLKAPRKTASENVVCLCHLLNILADFSNLFLHTGKGAV